MEEERLLTRVENIGVYVRHISREHNHEAHYLANLGADRVKKVIVEQGGNNERWKAVKGGFLMEAKRETAPAAAVWLSRVVDRESWITISKVAVPLVLCIAMAAEVTGACILADVLDLTFSQQLSVEN